MVFVSWGRKSVPRLALVVSFGIDLTCSGSFGRGGGSCNVGSTA